MFQPLSREIIEGQGSLLHPSYAGVTLGLVHGSQPDALVLCHEAGRERIHEVDGDYPIPPLDVVIDRYLQAARLTNANCYLAGISVNTSALDVSARDRYLETLQRDHAVPAGDPIATGITSIADRLISCR